MKASVLLLALPNISSMELTAPTAWRYALNALLPQNALSVLKRIICSTKSAFLLAPLPPTLAWSIKYNLVSLARWDALLATLMDV